MSLASDPTGRLEPHHKRTVLITVTITLVVLALVSGLGVFFLYRHLNGNIRQGDEIHHEIAKNGTGAPSQPLNILVMGVDTRDCAGCHVDNQAGENGSDTTILVHIPANRKSAYAISIPRDALVKPVKCTADRHYLGTDMVQWNAAFSAGGPDCTAEQIEKNFGVYVDHYITVNFGGFKDMVDAIGGVNVCIPKPLDDDVKLHVHFDAGKSVHLDGRRALTYVRLRHVGDGTDISRIKRQQSFIAAMVKQVISAGTLTRPSRLYGFANALTKSIQTDPEIGSTGALVKLSESLRSTNLGHIKFITLPNQIYDVPQGDPDWGRVQILPSAYKLMKAVAEDRSVRRWTKGSLTAKGPKKHASQKTKDADEAAGICS